MSLADQKPDPRSFLTLLCYWRWHSLTTLRKQKIIFFCFLNFLKDSVIRFVNRLRLTTKWTNPDNSKSVHNKIMMFLNRTNKLVDTAKFKRDIYWHFVYDVVRKTFKIQSCLFHQGNVLCTFAAFLGLNFSNRYFISVEIISTLLIFDYNNALFKVLRLLTLIHR